MTKSVTIRDALAALVKEKAHLALKVSFNHVNDGRGDYVHIMLRPARVDEGFGVFRRRVRVTMQVFLTPDLNGEVRHTDLYDIADALDEAINGCLKISGDNASKDRFVTVYDTSARIFDDILTYTFMLDFADCADFLTNSEKYELMRELELVTSN